MNQCRIADRLEAMDLAGLDDENVSSLALESLAVHRPHSLSLTDELNLVVGMTMRTRSRPGLAMEQEHGNAGVTLLCSDELMRATDEGKAFLADVMHAGHSSFKDSMTGNALRVLIDACATSTIVMNAVNRQAMPP